MREGVRPDAYSGVMDGADERDQAQSIITQKYRDVDRPERSLVPSPKSKSTSTNVPIPRSFCYALFLAPFDAAQIP